MSTEVNIKLETLAFTLSAIIAVQRDQQPTAVQEISPLSDCLPFLHSRPLKNYEDGRKINIKSSFKGCIVKFCIKQIAKLQCSASQET